MGFFSAMVWIAAIADEVVQVLQVKAKRNLHHQFVSCS
jgi:hypothetical protein